MTAAWIVAEGLEVLRRQLNELAPRRSTASDGGIGNAEHASRDSDHNPWWVFLGQAYVTARDFTHDPAGGLDCAWLAGRLQAHRDQRIKYVIWQRQIMAGFGGPQPWVWRPYSGTNPHTHHLHLSVVPDARALSRVAWRLDTPTATGPIQMIRPQEEDDLTPEQARMLAEIHRETTAPLPNRRGPNGEAIVGKDGKPLADTLFGYAMNADGWTYRTAWDVDAVHQRLDAVVARLDGLDHVQAPPALDYDQLAAALVRRFTA